MKATVMNQQPDPDPLGHYQFDAFGRFVDLNEMELERYPAPPPVRWVPVDDLASVKGMRVATNSRQGPQYDLRAATDVITDDTGTYVNVVEEWRWFYWNALPEDQRPPRVPRAIAYPTYKVWAEVYDT